MLASRPINAAILYNFYINNIFSMDRDYQLSGIREFK